MTADVNKPEDWLTEYRRLADGGDATAQIALAWEYGRGENVAKDMDAAVGLFRQAERKKRGLARFYLAKLKLLNQDPTFRNEIPDHYEPEFGPAFYLMGVARKRGILCEPNLDEAIRYFELGARDNHLVSKFFAWKLRNMSPLQRITTFPHAVCLSIKMVIIKFRNVNDMRILT